LADFSSIILKSNPTVEDPFLGDQITFGVEKGGRCTPVNALYIGIGIAVAVALVVALVVTLLIFVSRKRNYKPIPEKVQM